MADEALSSYQDWRMKICFEKVFWIFFHETIADLKIMRTFAAPLEKRVLARETDKFIEKTDLLYKKQVPRKYNLSRSVNFFGNYKCQDKLRNI